MTRRARLALALALLLPGCWSVIPGHDAVGQKISQGHRERDGRSAVMFYTWSDVPAGQPVGGWSPLVGAVNGLVSLTLTPLSLVLVPVRALTADEAPDGEDAEDEPPRVIIIEEEGGQ